MFIALGAYTLSSLHQERTRDLNYYEETLRSYEA